MPAFERTVSTSTGPSRWGGLRTVARVDDFFHGFEVVLETRNGDIARAEATSHRHPWTTCPGSLASVGQLEGQVGTAPDTVHAMARQHTCVHVNDLVWLASRQHVDRHYEIAVTPFEANLSRDGAPLVRWQLHQWKVTGRSPYVGLGVGSAGWREAIERVAQAGGVDHDHQEAVRVLRRGLLVAVGYYTLDWRHIETGADVDGTIMAGTCHTFSSPQVEQTVCLAATPERRSRTR